MNDNIRRLLNTLLVTLLLSASVCFVGVTFNGCGTPVQTAYKTEGTIVVTVDGAMSAWQDYVVAGHATRAQDEAVRSAYGKYQAAMTLALNATAAASGTGTNPADMQTKIKNVSAFAADFVALVSKFIPLKK